MNDANYSGSSATPAAPQDARDEAADPPILPAIGLYNCPPWAGDLVAALPVEADSASAAATTAPGEGELIRTSPQDAGEQSALRRPVAVRECPLHTAMRHLAEAAVAQHVLYLEGEVRARPDLIHSMSCWERMHTLIRECVCPATREVSVGAPALAEIVDTARDDLFAPGQQELQQQFVHALDACASCTSTAECPLGASPSGDSARP